MYTIMNYLEKKNSNLANAVENLKLLTGDLEELRKKDGYKNLIDHEIPKKKYEILLSEEILTPVKIGFAPSF